MNEMLNKIYMKRTQELGEAIVKQHVKALNMRLEQWNSELEDHLKFDAANSAQIVPSPSVLSLL